MDFQNPLDITTYSTLAKDDLKAMIVHDVEKTQSSSIIRPLPDSLIMRHDQYDLLQDDPDMSEMYEVKDQMYRTPLNVMLIRVEK